MFNKVVTNNYIKILLLLLIILPLCLHTWLLFNYTVNIPFFDDFQWAYKFLDEYEHQLTWGNKFKQLFSQHNEHRIVVTRLVILSLLNLEGELNFRHFTLVGNLFVLGIFICYCIYLRREKISLVWLTFVAFMWYQLQYFHNVIVSYAVPNNSVIFFAFLSFTCTYLTLKKYNKWIYAFAIITAVIAVFSNGNGVIVPLITMFLFAVRWEWKKMVHMAIVFLIAGGFYFWNLEVMPGRASFNTKTLLFFTDFLTVAIAPSSEIKSRIIGVVLILLVLILSIKNLTKALKHPLEDSLIFITGTLLFIVGTAVVTSIMRASYNLPPAPWYKGYSLLFVVSSVLLIYSELKNHKQRVVFYGIALTFSIFNFYQGIIYNIPNLETHYRTLKADRMNFALNSTWAFIPIQVNNDFVYFNQLTKQHIQNGTYPEFVVPQALKFPNLENAVVIRNGISFDSSSHIYVVVHESEKEPKGNTFGFIQNAESGHIIYYGFYRPLGRKKNIFEGKSIFSTAISFGVNSKMSKTVAKPGKYKAGFVEINQKGQVKWFVCADELQIENL